MFVDGERIGWSASDVSAAAECEYAVLRALDYRLGRATALDVPADPLLEHIGRLGDKHEAEVLARFREERTVIPLAHATPPLTRESRREAAAVTREVLESIPLMPELVGTTEFANGTEATAGVEAGAQSVARAGSVVVYQGAFFDGEFFGYADFLLATPAGWQVCDAKLAREAKPRALLQLGGYAAQVRALGLPLAPTVALLLGDGRREEFATADVIPVFLERQDSLGALLASHAHSGEPVAWGRDDVVVCGSCPECVHAAAAANDLILVAGMRMDQRRKLRAAGITTVAELASAEHPPEGLALATFERLRAQAALQWRQLAGGESAPVEYELVEGAAETLALLPAPSEGDLFFDFEGDPMYHEGDPTRIGLEYLWGIMDTGEQYRALWAHSSTEERDRFAEFMALLAEQRAAHPEMHVYHYAAYEVTALKRLAMRYQILENELDDLLRAEVFVDLYATVRGSVRVSAPSYSIKKLEPLYMGSHLRSDEDDSVAGGGDSVVAYHEFREMRRRDPEAASARLASLEDYNTYDCLSTLRLRDWLLERAEEAGVRDRIMPSGGAAENDVDAGGGAAAITGAGSAVNASADADSTEDDPGAAAGQLFAELVARSGPVDRTSRAPEEQAYAMLATALDYNARERKQFWWDHYDRLHHPVEEWRDTRDVFVVESAEVEEGWHHPGGSARNWRRVVRLVGDWSPGSKESDAQVVYGRPFPPRSYGPDSAIHAAARGEVARDPDNPRRVLLTETRPQDMTFSALPVALAPATPPRTEDIDAAIAGIARAAAQADRLPESAALDVLARRPPRLTRTGAGGEGTTAGGAASSGIGRSHVGGEAATTGGAASPERALPQSGNMTQDVVAALSAMDDSYVAVQGPPGSGKTYIGSRVIKELVERHRWRIGVVGQSHAVVENMLGAVVKAGLDPRLVGKDSNRSSDVTWTSIPGRSTAPRAKFLAERRGSGCVIGGTAWTFANPGLVAPGGLDLIVIDEAGQFSLAPTLAVSVAAQRLLLLGDPQQLPQVSQATHAEPVDESALGWLMAGHDTLPVEFGYFLAESYRMHPALCEKVSALSYEGRLGSAEVAGRRDLDGVEPGLEVVMLDHTGNRTESEEEADAVVAQVRAHLGRGWTDPPVTGKPPGVADPGIHRPLDERDFVVVAPYNAQVNLIQRKLAEAGFGGVRVGTVDRFQGQEAPVAIMSMTASSHGDVPRGMDFVLNRNRTNVGISRAQFKAVLIRSRALTAFMPTSTGGVLELGAFIGLCSPSDTARQSTAE